MTDPTPTARTCPLGEDCDLTVAWMAGSLDAREKCRARIEALEAERAAMRAEVERLRAFAEECASYSCTCNAAYYDRELVDPDCMSGEIGYDAQEVLGLPVTCKGILASRARRSARKDT